MPFASPRMAYASVVKGIRPVAVSLSPAPTLPDHVKSVKGSTSIKKGDVHAGAVAMPGAFRPRTKRTGRIAVAFTVRRKRWPPVRTNLADKAPDGRPAMATVGEYAYHRRRGVNHIVDQGAPYHPYCPEPSRNIIKTPAFLIVGAQPVVDGVAGLNLIVTRLPQSISIAMRRGVIWIRRAEPGGIGVSIERFQLHVFTHDIAKEIGRPRTTDDAHSIRWHDPVIIAVQVMGHHQSTHVRKTMRRPGNIAGALQGWQQQRDQ